MRGWFRANLRNCFLAIRAPWSRNEETAVPREEIPTTDYGQLEACLCSSGKSWVGWEAPLWPSSVCSIICKLLLWRGVSVLSHVQVHAQWECPGALQIGISAVIARMCPHALTFCGSLERLSLGYVILNWAMVYGGELGLEPPKHLDKWVLKWCPAWISTEFLNPVQQVVKGGGDGVWGCGEG